MIIETNLFNMLVLKSGKKEMEFAKREDVCFYSNNLLILAQKHPTENLPYNIILEKIGPIKSIDWLFDQLYTFVVVLSVDYNIKEIVCFCKKGKWDRLVREWSKRMPIHNQTEKEELVFDITNLLEEKEFKQYYEHFKKNEKICS